MEEQIIEKDGKKYKVIEIIEQQSDKEDKRITEFKKWEDKAYCLEAVKNYGYALQYVKNQTEKVCLEAVKDYGNALRYVKDQTEEVCLEAVKNYGDALRYVKVQTEKVCLEAVKNYGYALQYVKNRKIFEKITGLKFNDKINKDKVESK